jgi:hypothetical protein
MGMAKLTYVFLMLRPGDEERVRRLIQEIRAWERLYRAEALARRDPRRERTNTTGGDECAES